LRFTQTPKNCGVFRNKKKEDTIYSGVIQDVAQILRDFYLILVWNTNILSCWEN